MLDRLRRIQIPILTKITIPYAILALLVALGGSYLITNVIIDSVEERFTNQLIETAFLASESVVRQEDDLLEQLRLLSFLQGMGSAIEEGRSEDVATLAIPSAYNADIEALVVLNRFGRELLRLGQDASGQNYEELQFAADWLEAGFIQKVLAGEVDELGDKYSGVLTAGGRDYLFTAGPVLSSSGETQGFVLVGQPVESVVGLLREETFAQLTYYSLAGEPRTSTLSATASLDASIAETTINAQEQGSVTRDLSDNAIAYKELITPFQVRGGQDVGLLGVALPTNFLTQTSQITRTNTLILMSVILFLVIVVGIYTAGQITRPILDLKEAAVQVSQGNLNVRVKSSSRDEVAVLADSFNDMVGNVSQSKQDLLNAYQKTIEGWAKALDLRDHETEGHSRRVTELAMEMARRFNIPEEQLEHVERGALLHDIGKIGIPDSILLKPGSLTDEEYELMKQHPVFGRDFMQQIDFLEPALDIPYSHHEKWDGSGYPQGLKGEDIPLAARIFAVVDVWDAITKDRPYRKAMSFAEAIAIIEEGRGTHFDPEVADQFLEMMWEKVEAIK